MSGCDSPTKSSTGKRQLLSFNETRLRTVMAVSKRSPNPREWFKGLKKCFRLKKTPETDVQSEGDIHTVRSASMAISTRLKKLPRSEPSQRPPKYNTMVKNGSVPIDPHSAYIATHRVKSDGESETAYEYLLTRTDIASNTNDFIIGQLLEPFQSSVNRLYVVEIRSGRIGEIGTTQRSCWKEEKDAVRQFKMHFEEKAGGTWDSRDLLEPADRHASEYAYIPRRYPRNRTGSVTATTTPRPPSMVDCRLDKRVQQLATLIFPNTSASPMSIEVPTLYEVKYDANKLPLGPMTVKTLNDARGILYELDALLRESTTTRNKEVLRTLSSQYYTLIPHALSGTIPTIDNKAKVQRELQLLAALQVTIPALRFTERISGPDELYRKHRLDQLVQGLGLTVLEAVEKGSKEYRGVEKACCDTRGSHQLSFSVKDVFRVARQDEAERFREFRVDSENRMLLWHGSTLAKFQSILTGGLRVPTLSEKPRGEFGIGIKSSTATASDHFTFAHRHRRHLRPRHLPRKRIIQLGSILPRLLGSRSVTTLRGPTRRCARARPRRLHGPRGGCKAGKTVFPRRRDRRTKRVC